MFHLYLETEVRNTKMELAARFTFGSSELVLTEVLALSVFFV